MLAPVLKKLIEREDTFIERTLQVTGLIFVKPSDVVKPFDRLGECVFSQREAQYPARFRPFKFKLPKTFYHAGSFLGSLPKNKIMTPFNGNLTRLDDGSYVFNESESKYVLLSGVWGTVDKVNEKKSVLIKTRTKDLLMAASSDICASGELVVFPNPMEILEKSYLEKFSKSNEGKVIYVGHFASDELVSKAYEMGCSAIIAGSAHRNTFNLAKSLGLGFGLISGFGKLETPEPIYKLLSVIAYRYVFFQGERNLLRIPYEADITEPVETKTKIAKSLIRSVQIGADVISLQDPFFGKIGAVDRVLESSIFVRFSPEKSPVEIFLPNFYLVE